MQKHVKQRSKTMFERDNVFTYCLMIVRTTSAYTHTHRTEILS